MRLSRKIRVLLAVGLVALITGLIATSYFAPTVPSAEPVPIPNGFDDFVAGGKLLSSQQPDLKTASLDELRSWLASNQAGLERARAGLTKECACPLEYKTNYFRNMQVGLIRQIILAFFIEGKKSELEKNTEKAANSYLAALKIGTGFSRNGVLINALVSVTMENAALSSFQRLIPQLTAKQCRSNLASLEKIYREQEPFSAILIREKRYIQIYPLKDRLEDMIERRSLHPDADVQKKTKIKYEAHLLNFLRLQKDLASRAFELEKSRAPAKWDDLVPAYLPVIPVDPTTGKSLSFNF